MKERERESVTTRPSQRDWTLVPKRVSTTETEPWRSPVHWRQRPQVSGVFGSDGSRLVFTSAVVRRALCSAQSPATRILRVSL